MRLTAFSRSTGIVVDMNLIRRFRDTAKLLPRCCSRYEAIWTARRRAGRGGRRAGGGRAGARAAAPHAVADARVDARRPDERRAGVRPGKWAAAPRLLCESWLSRRASGGDAGSRRVRVDEAWC